MLDFIQKKSSQHSLHDWVNTITGHCMLRCPATFDTNRNRLKYSRNEQIDLRTTVLCTKLSGTSSDKFHWPGSVLQPAGMFTVTHPFPRNVL